MLRNYFFFKGLLKKTELDECLAKLKEANFPTDVAYAMELIFVKLNTKNLLTETNVDAIFEFAKYANQINNTLDIFSEIKNFPAYYQSHIKHDLLNQEALQSIIMSLQESEGEKRREEIRQTLYPTLSAEPKPTHLISSSALGFFTKSDPRIIPEKGVVDIICSYHG